jgi:hypothetical protein
LDAVTLWLESNCGVGGEAVSDATLRALGDEATDRFIAAFRSPDRRTASAVARDAAERHAERSARARQGARFALDAASLAAMRGIDEATYVARAVADFESRYRMAALRGLGVVGSARAAAYLEEVAADASSPWSDAARAALGRIRG